ncbi:6,7-dimethyl-8-ribityllumazine synthase [bacterium]|nr:6,7-dimethyl-8-ribityllumazine synthase [bacterium]
MPEITYGSDGSRLRVAVVVGRFNEPVTTGLLAGALGALESLGVLDPDVIWVPGAFEIPVVAATLAGDHDCVVALGAVIEGQTDHYEHIATQATAGIAQVALASGVPVANGILAAREPAHAVARSRPDSRNKGAEAAEAAVGAALALAALRAR